MNIEESKTPLVDCLFLIVHEVKALLTLNHSYSWPCLRRQISSLTWKSAASSAAAD